MHERLTTMMVAIILGIQPGTVRRLAQLGLIEKAPADQCPDQRTPLYLRESVEAYRDRRRERK